MHDFFTAITSTCSFSYHTHPGYIEFTNPLIQQIWEENFLPTFTPFLPSHIDLVVDIVDDYNSNEKTLRLLAIYNAKQRQFDWLDNTLLLFGLRSGFYLDCLYEKQIPLYSHIS